MPNSSTSVRGSGLYVPLATGMGARSEQESDGVQAYVEHAMDGLEDYARREPWRFAAWVLGVGFVLGWKLKPW